MKGVNKIDAYSLSCFMHSNKYPQRLEDIQIAIEKEIPNHCLPFQSPLLGMLDCTIVLD